MRAGDCPFCNLAAERICSRNEVGHAVRDLYPASNGHTLVIPSRHVGSIFELTDSEIAGLWELTGQVRRELAHELRPDGFNIALNDGIAAGQTIDHAHIHVIPRFNGDVDDPRGGVRWVIPAQAEYWKE